MRNPIIVALDGSDRERAMGLARSVSPSVGVFKVGLELFTASGVATLNDLRGMGASVFLDLKLFDIPNTVAGAVERAVDLGVQMLTLHASGGARMLRAAREAADRASGGDASARPLLLGVTVLTSFDEDELRSVGVAGDVGTQVERLADIAVSEGLDGLVCSARELPGLRERTPGKFELVTPGIRPAAAGLDDQRRVMTPEQAMRLGADWLVIGRPIYRSDDPAAAAAAIWGSLRDCLGEETDES